MTIFDNNDQNFQSLFQDQEIALHGGQLDSPVTNFRVTELSIDAERINEYFSALTRSASYTPKLNTNGGENYMKRFQEEFNAFITKFQIGIDEQSTPCPGKPLGASPTVSSSLANRKSE